MGCGCGKRGASAAPQPDARMSGVEYGGVPSMLRTHVGPAAHPATNAAGVYTSPDAFAGVTDAMRAAVVPSRMLVFPHPSGNVARGAMGRVGAVIVPATSPVPVVTVAGYLGQLPFDVQPSIVKPKPWAQGS